MGSKERKLISGLVQSVRQAGNDTSDDYLVDIRVDYCAAAAAAISSEEAPVITLPLSAVRKPTMEEVVEIEAQTAVKTKTTAAAINTTTSTSSATGSDFQGLIPVTQRSEGKRRGKQIG